MGALVRSFSLTLPKHVRATKDPIVVRHAGARMADNENIAVVPADLR